MEYTDIELKNEQWRDIDGYDGAYQVSDLGRVRSHKRGEWRVLMAYKNRDGYLSVMLSKHNKANRFLVHRLVAQEFIENSDKSKNEINHINEIKTDNRATNLEWCDRRYNNTYNGLQQRRLHPIQSKVKDIYNPDLTYKQNLELFNLNGITCSGRTLWKLRKNLGLIK